MRRLLLVAVIAQAIFRSGVQYVAVDVVVTDKNDKPITDLKREDFSITENGKPQKVDDFQFVSVPAVTRAIEATTKVQPEPDVATNIAPSPNSRLFVIVIDDLHLIEQDIIRIKTVLRDLVQNFSPDDEVALTFVSFSNLSVNFTRNHHRIPAAMGNVKGGRGFGLPGSFPAKSCCGVFWPVCSVPGNLRHARGAPAGPAESSGPRRTPARVCSFIRSSSSCVIPSRATERSSSITMSSSS